MSRIKGITIEIGGETTGLQKALKDVNKQSTDLQKELKQVDRLLKFNPGNTELLAQQQELLGNQIETTSTKLHQLKEAQKQVEEQFKNGEINGEQYRAFNRELAATEGQLNGLKNKMSNLQEEQDRVANSTKQLEAVFDMTTTSLEDYTDVIGEKLASAIRNGTATSKQLEQAIEKVGQAAFDSEIDVQRFKDGLKQLDDGASLDKVKKDLDQIADEARAAREEVSKFGGEIESVAGAIVAGGGLAGAIQTALDTSTLDTKIDISMEVPPESVAAVKSSIKTVEAYGVDAEASLDGVRRQWTLNADATDEANARVVKGAATISAAYSQIDFSELIQETNEIASELEIADEAAVAMVNSLLNIGFPPEQLDIISEYGAQLKRAGFNAEEVQAIMAAGVETGTWNIDNLLDGLKEGRIKLAEFGEEVPKATADLLKGTSLTVEELEKFGDAAAKGGKEGTQAFKDVAKEVSEIENATKRNVVGAAIFGTMWEDQGEKITDTILNMDKHLVSADENQSNLNDSVKKLDEDPAVQLRKAISDLKSAMEPLLEVIADVVSAVAEWASENPKLASTIAALAGAASIAAGAFLLFAPIVTAVTGAIAGAGGVTAILSGALAFLTGPVGLAIAALAGLTVGGIALSKEMNKSSIEVDLFGKGVSKSTQEAVGGFMELNDKATIALNELAWSGKTVTGEMASSIVETFNQMGDQVTVAMKEDHAEQLTTMQEFFAQSSALSDTEEAQILANIQQSQTDKQAVIAEGQARVNEIVQTALAEQRGITEAEYTEMGNIQKNMTDNAIIHLTENEREQKAILERMKIEASEITATQAAQVVQNSLKQKEAVVAEANDQYNKVVANAILQRDETGGMTAEQAAKVIADAKLQRDESVGAAEDMHQKVVNEAKLQAQEHAREVDWETGEIKTKWEVFKTDMEKIAGWIGTAVSAKWKDTKRETSENWEEIKAIPGKMLRDAGIAVGKEMLDISNKIKGKLDDITGFFKNVKLKLPKIELPKLPKFTISGSFGLNPPSVPSFGVDWYDKGGIFTGPQIIGVGEKRPEFVGALEDLEVIVKKAMMDVNKQSNRSLDMSLLEKYSDAKNQRTNQFGNQSLHNYADMFRGSTLVIREEADIQKIVDEMERRTRYEDRANGTFSYK